MIITRFNRFVAKHGRAAFIVIGLVIVIPFVFFFGPGKARTGDGGYTGPVARIHGKKIDRDTFMQHMQAVDIVAILQFGRGFSSDDRFRSFWMQETLKRLVGLEEARRRGLDAVTEEQIVQYVRGIPRFQDPEGGFNKEAFEQFANDVLARRGISGPEFDRLVHDTIIIDRFEEMATAGVFVSEEELSTAVRRGETEIELKYNEMTYRDVLPDVDLAPSDDDIQTYFEQFGDSITLPEQKKIVVAEFRTADIELDEPITQEAIEQYYDGRKQIFKDMEQEKAHDRIRGLLRSGKQRDIARERAEAVRRAATAKMQAEEDALPGPQALREAAEELTEMEVAVKESGWFTPDMPIPNVGMRPRLASAAYKLTDDEPLSGPIYDRAGFYVACLLETAPGERPDELTAEVKEIISERLVQRKIEAYYERNVEPYREQIERGMTPDDLIADKRLKLSRMPDLTDSQRDQRLSEYREAIDTYLKPYYNPPERKALVAAFTTEAFRGDVTVTNEDAREYYDDNEAKYSKSEVKARHILLEVEEDAEGEALAEARVRLEEIRARIVEGADFAEMAEEHSEGPSAARGGDLGWFTKDRMVAPFAETAFAMEVGDLSDIVRTRFGLHLIKVEDRRDGQSFEAVAGDITEMLLNQKAEREAKVAAYEFADKVYTAVQERASAVSAAKAFSTAAERRGREISETPWFGPQGRIPSFPREFGLAGKLYRVSEQTPVSEVIEGRQGAYVACWVDTREGSLPTIQDNAQVQRALRRQMQREQALELVRERGRNLHNTLREKLAEGVPFEEALPSDVSFESVDPFKISGRPPRDLPQARAIMAALPGTSAPALLDPMESDDGMLLVFLAARQLPAEETLAANRDMYRMRLRQQKEQALLADTYTRLQEDADLEMLGPWAEQE